MFDKLWEFIAYFGNALIPITVLKEYEAGVIFRLGKFHKTAGAGWHWMIPFVDDLVYEHSTLDTHILPPQPLTTKDGCQIAIQPLLSYRVSDVKKLLLTCENKEKALQDSAAGIISIHALNSTWDQICKPEFVATVFKEVRKRGFRYGIEVEELQFPGLQKTRTYMLLQNHKYE